ncbi:MAG: FTR1 family protein [Rhodospirillales bacterium]|nr:FTR1 family protein [Rhodospirillales bacterium]
MLETMLITFREGLEAFLIIAITLAYLTKTGRTALIKPVYAGAGVALLISATTGYHIRELAQEPVTEGVLALIAGALVASLTYYVMKTAKHIRQDIHNRLERHAAQDGAMAEIGIFLFTVLMIAREGMETALMLGAMSGQTGAVPMIAGALGGLALVGLIGYAWMTQSHKINLRLFMQVTGMFLVLFSVHLFLYGLHELSEMNALPLLSEDMNVSFHIATEPFEPGQPIGDLITYSLLALPCGWLLFSFVRDRFAAQPHAAE